ncbi:MAG: sigma-70 family RNA polymerase sigma factor [Odoribacteraceae bacterium]|jgi:RNA polymerase sigma-70 factor (ECF subfamily)|nr:sigma-70 family RNA polymerase sigma factor [Odoribacteraceae bacterium]
MKQVEETHAEKDELALISTGDMSVFTSTFKKYYRPLVLFANAIVKDVDVAEDLVQAFFCKLWEERSSLARVTCCKSYLYQSIKNCCQNYLRHQRVVAALLPPGEVLDETILQTIMEEEMYVELIRQIDLLPPKCREVMLLKLQEMDNSMIATTCHVTEETVRSQYRRGKALLRKQLQPAFKNSLAFPLLLSIMKDL